MSDLYDVQNVLASLAQNAVYPDGLNNSSVTNNLIRIYPGWPEPNSLDADLTNLNAHISIFPTTQIKTSTRFETNWQTVSIQSPTIVMSVASNQQSITLTGTISTPQTLMAIVNGIGFNYPVKPTDTLETIAEIMGKIIPGGTWNNNVILVPGAKSITTFVSTPGSSVRELAREKRLFYVVIWCATPLQRSQIGNAVAELFASTYRILMPDGLWGQLSFQYSRERDIQEKKKLYRRDIYCEFEHAISQTELDYVIADNIIKLLSPFNTNGIHFLDGNQIYLLDGNPLVFLGD